MRENIKANREAGHTRPFKVPGLLSLVPKHEPRWKGFVLYCWLPGRFDGKWGALEHSLTPNSSTFQKISGSFCWLLK